jgi:hypothetical protein
MNDARIIALIDNEADVLRYRLERVLYGALSENDHLHAYNVCIEGYPHLRLDQNEETSFLEILHRSHHLAHFSETVVSIASLRNLQQVKAALASEHTARTILENNQLVPIEFMEDAWELQPSGR